MLAILLVEMQLYASFSIKQYSKIEYFSNATGLPQPLIIVHSHETYFISSRTALSFHFTFDVAISAYFPHQIVVLSRSIQTVYGLSL